MTGAPDQVARWRRSDIARWSLCAATILAVHAGAAAYVAMREPGPPPGGLPAVAVMQMLPEVSAPQSPSTEMPPGPETPKVEDLPEKRAEKPDDEDATTEALKPAEPEPDAPPAPVAPKPDVAVAPSREPEPPAETKPVEKKPIEVPKRPEPKKKHVEKPKLVTAPPPSQTARAQSAPIALAPPAPSNAVPEWRGMVSALLERNKRIPPGARSRSVRGTAGVSFSIGRSGQLISVSLNRSAGDSELDEEAVALVRRVGSFPPPPPEMRGASVSLSVPIRFDVR